MTALLVTAALSGSTATTAVAAAGTRTDQGAAVALSPQTTQGQPIGTNRLVSVRTDGTPPDDGDSIWSAVSSSGRYVAFVSKATGLVDPSLCADNVNHVYRRDRQTGVTSLVDARPDGTCGNRAADAAEPSISADGRLVAFASNAGDLTPVGGAGLDVFVRNVSAGTTTIVSLAHDGRRPDNFSKAPDISADGSTVVFESRATNLLDAEPPESELAFDYIFRHDLATGETALVSTNIVGGYPDRSSNLASVSGDGALIAYFTAASDIVAVQGPYLYNVIGFDVATGTSWLISATWSGQPPDGGSFVPAVSADGSTVAFRSDANNLVPADDNDREDIFTFDVAAATITLITRSRHGGSSNGISRYPDISADGTKIAFNSYASNLVERDRNGQSDVFLHDTTTGVTSLVSRTRGGRAADGDSSGYWRPAIAGDGSLVTYSSDAHDIVAGTPDSPHPRYQVYGYRVR